MKLKEIVDCMVLSLSLFESVQEHLKTSWYVKQYGCDLTELEEYTEQKLWMVFSLEFRLLFNVFRIAFIWLYDDVNEENTLLTSTSYHPKFLVHILFLIQFSCHMRVPAGTSKRQKMCVGRL